MIKRQIGITENENKTKKNFYRTMKMNRTAWHMKNEREIKKKRRKKKKKVSPQELKLKSNDNNNKVIFKLPPVPTYFFVSFCAQQSKKELENEFYDVLEMLSKWMIMMWNILCVYCTHFWMPACWCWLLRLNDGNGEYLCLDWTSAVKCNIWKKTRKYKNNFQILCFNWKMQHSNQTGVQWLAIFSFCLSSAVVPSLAQCKWIWSGAKE